MRLKLIYLIVIFTIVDASKSLKAQIINHRIYQNPSNSFNDIHRKSILSTTNQDILTCGYTADYDTSIILNRIYNNSYPTLIKTNFDGSLKNTNFSIPFKFYYDLKAIIKTDTVYRPYPADYKTVIRSSKGNYYSAGNFKSLSNLFITETDENTGNIIKSIGIQGSRLTKIVPTILVEYNGILFCIGYCEHQVFNTSEGKFFLLKVDMSLNTIIFFEEFYFSNTPLSSFSNEEVFPLDAIVYYNTTTLSDEIAIIGETNRMDYVYGAGYDHPMAFFLRYDISSDQVQELTVYPYQVSLSPLTLEDTYSKTFLMIPNADTGVPEFYIGGMTAVTIADKCMFVLKVDQNGSIITQKKFEQTNYNTGGIKLYPNDMDYDPVSDNLLIAIHKFYGLYKSIDENNINSGSMGLKWEYNIASGNITNPRKYFLSASEVNPTGILFESSNNEALIYGTRDYNSSIEQFYINDNNYIGCGIELDTVSEVYLNIAGHKTTYTNQKDFVQAQDYDVVPLDFDRYEMQTVLLCSESGEQSFKNSGSSSTNKVLAEAFINVNKIESHNYKLNVHDVQGRLLISNEFKSTQSERYSYFIENIASHLPSDVHGLLILTFVAEDGQVSRIKYYRIK